MLDYLKKLFTRPATPALNPNPEPNVAPLGSIGSYIGVKTMDFQDLMLMTATIWGEARSESFMGKQAVAHVIVNRVKHGGWWGNTARTVMLKPYQFSCWNKDDPSYPFVRRIGYEWNKENVMNSKIIWDCLLAALSVVQNQSKDMTYGATHYHADYVSPSWAKGKKAVAAIGRHYFYNDIS